MRVLIFIKDIFKKFPLLLINNTVLLFIVNLIDAVSIVSLVVLVDIFLNPSLQGASAITKKIVALLSFLHLPATFGWLLFFFLMFNVLKISFQIFAQNSILKTKYALQRDLMLGTFQDFFNAKWYFFSSGKQGMLLNTFMRELTVVGDAFGAMARYFAGVLQVMLYLIVPFYLSWQVTSLSIAIALFFTIPFFLLGKVSYRLGKLNTITANQIGAVIQESLSLVKVILGFGNQAKSVKSLGRVFDAHCDATIKSQTLSYAMPLMYYPFGLLVLIIGLLVARKLTLPLSETIVLFYALMRLIPAVSSLTAEKSYLDNFFPSYEQVMDLRRRSKELKQPTGLRQFSGFDQELIIEDLSFAYAGHAPVLTDINMRIPKGKMIAIVGESGTGKSTLIDMVMGFHEPTSGRITIDQALLQEFDINSYRRHLGYVPQDSVLFNATIKDNLRWAKDDAVEAEIKHACQQANAEEFISKLPDGYNTLVGDRGVRLSGGQIQRIALARAILRNPSMLILDEATSALDTYSERLIQQAIETIAKETTVIVVAHRLSTIVNADYIYVLKEGRIQEEGAYAQLIQKNGHFNKMVQLQTLEIAK